jgi:menaquinone-dependent protoporphyrinogen IX oxidase
MDRRDRIVNDDRNERVLVVVAGRDVRATTIAELVVESLTRDHLMVDLANAELRAGPSPADYEIVLIGSSIRFGRYASSIIRYITHHLDALAAIPGVFFAVCDASPPYSDDDPGGHIARITRATGWSPIRSATFAKARRFANWLGARPTISIADRLRARELAAMVVDEVPPIRVQP